MFAKIYSFYKKIKLTNPRCKILVELPTYPYDKEYSDYWYRLPLLWKDTFWRKKLHLYVDRIVTFDNSNRIFGIPTIIIKNGIQIENYHIKKQNASDCVNIGCVARFTRYHGIDRLLLGLAKYKSEKNKSDIHLFLAGNGEEIKKLKSIVDGLKLNKTVSFLGFLDGEEWYNELYDKCDMGIDAFGGHRQDIGMISSSLKSREYLAVGLPIITSSNIDVFNDEAVDFCIKVPADESPIDIKEILRHYDLLLKKESKEELSLRIRK